MTFYVTKGSTKILKNSFNETKHISENYKQQQKPCWLKYDGLTLYVDIGLKTPTLVRRRITAFYEQIYRTKTMIDSIVTH